MESYISLPFLTLVFIPFHRFSISRSIANVVLVCFVACFRPYIPILSPALHLPRKQSSFSFPSLLFVCLYFFPLSLSLSAYPRPPIDLYPVSSLFSLFALCVITYFFTHYELSRLVLSSQLLFFTFDTVCDFYIGILTYYIHTWKFSLLLRFCEFVLGLVVWCAVGCLCRGKGVWDGRIPHNSASWFSSNPNPQFRSITHNN